MFTMPMEGKAALASVHNFKLVDSNSRQKTFLMGQLSDIKYNIDVCYPLSILQGFGVAVSSITFKLCT